jgi:hypothetical protein
MHTVRYVTMGMLVLLQLAIVSIPTALGSQSESPIPSSALATATYSGDDDYDPAAGGTPELSTVALPERSTRAVAVSYSGDDDYDPAAGGTPELSLLSFVQDSSLIACDSVSSGN